MLWLLDPNLSLDHRVHYSVDSMEMRLFSCFFAQIVLSIPPSWLGSQAEGWPLDTPFNQKRALLSDCFCFHLSLLFRWGWGAWGG